MLRVPFSSSAWGLVDEFIDRFAKGHGPVADAQFLQLKSFVEFQSPLPECRLAAILFSTYFYYSYGHTLLTLPCSANTGLCRRRTKSLYPKHY